MSNIEDNLMRIIVIERGKEQQRHFVALPPAATLGG